MRVKADSRIGRYARAFLDGVEVSSDCVEADDLAGWVLCIVKDANGHLVPDSAGEPQVERRHGLVTISLRDDAPEPIKAELDRLRQSVTP